MAENNTNEINVLLYQFCHVCATGSVQGSMVNEYARLLVVHSVGSAFLLHGIKTVIRVVQEAQYIKMLSLYNLKCKLFK